MAVERRRAPTFAERRMIDVPGAELIEIGVRSDGKAVWVKVDGRCCLRVTDVEAIEIVDARVPRGTSAEARPDVLREMGVRGAPRPPAGAQRVSRVAAREDGEDRDPGPRKTAPLAP